MSNLVKAKLFTLFYAIFLVSSFIIGTSVDGWYAILGFFSIGTCGMFSSIFAHRALKEGDSRIVARFLQVVGILATVYGLGETVVGFFVMYILLPSL